MYNVLTVSQIRSQESETILKLQLSEDELIERAAKAVAEEIIVRKKPCKVLVAAGGGNNGADGLSIALILKEKKYDVEILLASQKFNNFVSDRIQKCKAASIRFINELDNIGNYSKKKYEIIIDAIFGIGLNKKIENDAAKIIKELNAYECAYKIAVDIPSGLNADTGKVEGVCFAADLTVSFSFCKTGLLLNDAPNFVGEIIIKNIGVIDLDTGLYLCEEEDIIKRRRKRISHKYDYGKVVIIGGSINMPGAPAIAALAALKGGAGLCVTAFPDCLKNAFPVPVLESMYQYLPSKDGKMIFDEKSLTALFNKTTVIAIGPGMPPDEELTKIIVYLCKNFDKTLILDAGALSCVAKNPDILKNSKAKIILTPHSGEFEKLTNTQKDKDKPIYERVKSFAAKYNAVVLYKSAYSVISDGEKVFFNVFGTAALAKGGSGDALTGLVAALSCRNEPLKAAYRASCVLGKAGEYAENDKGSEGLLATEVVEYFF